MRKGGVKEDPRKEFVNEYFMQNQVASSTGGGIGTSSLTPPNNQTSKQKREQFAQKLREQQK